MLRRSVLMGRVLVVGLIVGLVAGSCAVGIDPPDLSEMIRIDGGAFFMGGEAAQVLNRDGESITDRPGVCRQDKDSDAQCFDRRQVRRCVVLSSFQIDRHEVTNDQYRHCVERGGCSEQEFSNSGAHDDYRDNARFDVHPTVSVTWFQAQEYCEWAGKRLPSEAEWEFTAEGSDGRRFPWGNDAPKGCSVNNNSCSVTSHNDTEGSPVAVMDSEYTFDATPELVRDLAGNVQEWVADIYEETSYCDSADSSSLGCGPGDATCMRAACALIDDCVNSCNIQDDRGFFCQAPPINAVFANPHGPPGNVTPDSEMTVRGSSFNEGTICHLEGSHRRGLRADSEHVQVGFRCLRDLLTGSQACSADADCGSGSCDGGKCTGEPLPTSCAGL